MLEGKTVNLKVLERNDLPLIGGWINDVEFFGQYFSPMQLSKTEVEKMFEPGPHELKSFVIEKKNGTTIGEIGHFYALHPMRAREKNGWIQTNPNGKVRLLGAEQLLSHILPSLAGIGPLSVRVEPDKQT